MQKFKGLTREEVEHSRAVHGSNTLPKEKTKGFIRRFFENLGDPIIKILLIALLAEVVFTLGNCDLFEVFGIVIAILIATTVSTLSELGSEAAFRHLEAESAESVARVIRDGELISIPIGEIVIGDILSISAGERIHADGIIVDGAVTVDQSALNGESREISKSAGDGGAEWDLSDKQRVFHGSTVTSGTALVRVGRIGQDTYYGAVARDVQAETRESPLKLRLSRLASQISKIGYVMAALVAITYLFFNFVVDNEFVLYRIIASFKDTNFLVSSLLHALTLMITVVVVAVPEGLPMMITVVLSANMKRMHRDKILVKKLVGIETAGSMNILFTDKTGTLTTGKLACDRVVIPGGTLRTVAALKRHPHIFSELLVSAKYNTDTRISENEIIGGNATDRAIAELFLGEEAPDVEISDKKSFSSQNKYSSVTTATGKTYFKGAAEVIIAASNCTLNDRGERIIWDSSTVLSEYYAATARGERAIAVAVSESASLCDLAFLGLIILKDKLRPDVKGAVRDVIDAGIQIVMLTGDGKETAVAIAEECGIYRERSGHLALTSDEFSRLRDDEVKEILPYIRVISRALPSDKTRLVRLSQEENLVVGMTGDGINDAPSLKLADVGFAMGSGTDIAKGAGDIVILDDSFSAISKTVLYGRTIFKSIRKFITFQLIMNLAACGVSLLGQFIGIDNPITIIQMLWINIIMDTLGGLAFAGEAPLPYYMKESPKRRDEPILSADLLCRVGFLGAYTLLVCSLFLKLEFFRDFYGYSHGNGKFLTAFYALFVFMGLFNCFLARSERLWIFSNIGKNKPFVLIMLLISAVQIIMIYFGGTLFRTVPISAREIWLVVTLASTTVLFELTRRIFDRLK